jgi:hypothetical protein
MLWKMKYTPYRPARSIRRNASTQPRYSPVRLLNAALSTTAKADHVSEKVDHLFRARQPAQISVDDDAVEAVVYKNQQAGKQLCENFHRSSGLRSCLDNSIIVPTAVGIKISNIFG